MKGCATMWIRLALGIAMVGALAATSEAGVIYDVRAMGANPKAMTANPGGIVKMQLWALVSNTNGNNADDGFRQTHLSIVSQPGTPNLRGNIVTRPDPDGVGGSQVSPDNVAPFADPLGSQPGVAVDLDADGDMDLGDLRTSGAVTANYFISSTGVNPISWPAVPDTGKQASTIGGAAYSGFLIGTFDFALQGGELGQTARVNAVPRQTGGPSGLLHAFRQDGVNRSLAGNNAEVTVGAPVVVDIIPEPSTIALVGAGLLGLVLVARRRRA